VLEDIRAMSELRLVERAHRELERQGRQHAGRDGGIDGVQRFGDVGVVRALERPGDMDGIRTVEPGLLHDPSRGPRGRRPSLG
jgi:hypothetical protein